MSVVYKVNIKVWSPWTCWTTPHRNLQRMFGITRATFRLRVHIDLIDAQLGIATPSHKFSSEIHFYNRLFAFEEDAKSRLRKNAPSISAANWIRKGVSCQVKTDTPSQVVHASHVHFKSHKHHKRLYFHLFSIYLPLHPHPIAAIFQVLDLAQVIKEPQFPFLASPAFGDAESAGMPTRSCRWMG